MKRKNSRIKSNIFVFVISAILFSVVVVSAATLLKGNEIQYTGSTVAASNIQEALDKLYDEARPVIPSQCEIPTYSVGDYIRIVPDSNSYKIPASLTGYDNEQEINPSGLTLWRVIKVNPCNVEVVSEYVSSEAIHFKGKTGYKNYIGTLKSIANQYINQKYTSGARMVGYSSQTEYIASDVTIGNTGTTSTADITSGYGSEINNGLAGDTLYINDYQLIRTAYGAQGLIAYDVTETNTKRAYWLASRKFESSNPESYWSSRAIHTDGTLDIYDLYIYMMLH